MREGREGGSEGRERRRDWGKGEEEGVREGREGGSGGRERRRE